MRLDINLASQPYEDSRQFWMRWGTAVGAVALLTLVLLALDVTGWVNARRDRAAIAEKKAMIGDRDRIRAVVAPLVNLPENRTTRDESQFLNQLIERKAFSWTRVLENLEKVMPPHVHLESISPQLDVDNQLGLKMTVAGDSRDRALELARRMEGQFLTTFDDLVARARTGKLGPDDFQRTTISLTNPGTVGTGASVPRLVPGQGAIVATGSIDYPPEFQGASDALRAQFGIAKIMTLTCTYDHRIIQGAESGAFLDRVRASA